MATLRDIRNRITSVQKTQKIVRAMKMVAAAKLARAQHAIESARPYALKLREVMGSVTSGVEADVHPLLVVRPTVQRLDVVLFTSDRGLCGAFNANCIKRALALIERREGELESISVIPVGRKGDEYMRRHGHDVPRAWTGISTATPEVAAEIGEFLMKRYESGEADQTVLVFAEFASALTQRPCEEVLIPLQAPESEQAPQAYEIEPDPAALLRQLVPRAIEFSVFRALLESHAGEHGARMTAMDSATNNTEELTRTLTLDYNKARQAAITAELVEIVSGAQAL